MWDRRCNARHLYGVDLAFVARQLSVYASVGDRRGRNQCSHYRLLSGNYDHAQSVDGCVGGEHCLSLVQLRHPMDKCSYFPRLANKKGSANKQTKGTRLID